eukprot:10021-Heterococcus_DN1.PRE.3
MSTLTDVVHRVAAAVLAVSAGDRVRSGVFSWLAADSANMSIQEAAQYADAAVLATGFWLLRNSYIFGPIALFYVHFNTTGSAPKSRLGREFTTKSGSNSAPTLVLVVLLLCYATTATDTTSGTTVLQQLLLALKIVFTQQYIAALSLHCSALYYTAVAPLYRKSHISTPYKSVVDTMYAV